MINQLSIHHIAPYIVEKQLSGHSYAVPALCQATANKINTHMHVVGNNNLVFLPNFAHFLLHLCRVLSDLWVAPWGLPTRSNEMAKCNFVGNFSFKTLSFNMSLVFTS